MKQNKRIVAVVLALIILSGCTSLSVTNSAEKNIITVLGFEDMSMANLIADVDNLEAVTELSSQLIECKVVDILDVSYTETDELYFQYNVEITNVLYDARNVLSEGDFIIVGSNNGLIPATIAAEKFGNKPRMQKVGLLQGEYTENDYVMGSVYGCIPLEVGEVYILFITDRYIDVENIYADSSRSFVYKIEGNRVYTGRDKEISEFKKNELVKMLESYTSKRTGMVDDVGAFEYMRWLGERQK